MTKEDFRDIPNYEGIYRVSSKGNVMSVERYVKHNYGGLKKLKERILKQSKKRNGYWSVSLKKEGLSKTYSIHQLVAMAFLNHTPCGHNMVINHIDNDKNNNDVSNLEVVSVRYNLSCHKKGLSKYTGVHLHKPTKKWLSSISLNGKRHHIGLYKTEEEARNAYINKLKEYNDGDKV